MLQYSIFLFNFTSRFITLELGCFNLSGLSVAPFEGRLRELCRCLVYELLIDVNDITRLN